MASRDKGLGFGVMAKGGGIIFLSNFIPSHHNPLHAQPYLSGSFQVSECGHVKDLPCNYTIKRVQKTSEADLGTCGQTDDVDRMCVGCLENRFTSFSYNGQPQQQFGIVSSVPFP